MKYVIKHKVMGYYIEKGKRESELSYFRCHATRFDTLEDAKRYVNRYRAKIDDPKWYGYEEVD